MVIQKLNTPKVSFLGAGNACEKQLFVLQKSYCDKIYSQDSAVRSKVTIAHMVKVKSRIYLTIHAAEPHL